MRRHFFSARSTRANDAPPTPERQADSFGASRSVCLGLPQSLRAEIITRLCPGGGVCGSSEATLALDRFGARTEELLRNTLYTLSANGLTLAELAPFLARSAFRTTCLKQVKNAEIPYFETRYDPLGTPMQAVMREPILNKTSAFTTDPHFRHIVGQEHSPFHSAKRWMIVTGSS